jgi:hypothetical protein
VQLLWRVVPALRGVQRIADRAYWSCGALERHRLRNPEDMVQPIFLVR